MALVRAAQQTSSSSRYCRYHVFLSFRGDTRKNFTDHLYRVLVNAGFQAFRDVDELERGEDIKPELLKAIQRSRISVIVFSKDYGSSSWCLDELVNILQRNRSSADHVILPVFYDVDPSHLRKQTGSLADAFARHQKSQSANKVNRWREALAEAADLAGMVLQNQADGSGMSQKFIRKLDKVIGDKLSRTPVIVSPTMIGMDSRSRIIDSWLRDGSLDIGVLVMYGMSGIGKTTIAKHVYNSNFSRFEGSSFLENIREKSQLLNGLVQIQRQLLCDILNGRKVKIQSVSEGITKIEGVISSKKVLVVLDDVDHMDQFDAILRMKDQFYPGSKIIVTTKRARLSNARQVTKKHEVGTLHYNESMELFSWHAFGQVYPIEGYKEHSEKLVHHCGGLPLALQVLGSSLSGESIGVWESALEKFEAIPNDEIMNKLRISYESLQDDHDQNLFLHIACFFIGNDKDYIVKILDGCDFYTIIGIQNLIDRCLVTIDHDKVLMHDMIREMGREIVRLESEEPSKRSRVWHYKDSFKILMEKTGTQTIEGLVLNMHMNPANSPINSNERVLETSAFARMHKLKLLHLNHVRLNGCYAEFPVGLRWLCWIDFPLDSIPIDFPMESLIVLEMQYSSLRQVIFKGTKSLKILDLSHSHGITETGDFSSCPNLEKMILVDCASLIEVHESIGYLERLVYLNMKDCKNLRVLPKSMFMLKLLETLIISGCSNLYDFPVEMMNNMESLKVLEIDEVPINELGPGRSSCILSSLPCSVVALSLGECNLSDDAFPTDFSSLSSLRSLDLENNQICSLPNCIKGLTRLDELSFSNCTRLKSLVGLGEVGRLNIANCTSLEKIRYQSFQCSRHTILSNNHNLIEWGTEYKLELIGSVDVEMINLLGLCNSESMAPIRMYKPYSFRKKSDLSPSPIQGMYEKGVFSTFFAGNEVPGKFSHKSRGSSISLTVPLLHSHSIRGLIVFAVYADSGNDSRPNVFRDKPGPLVTRVRNKSKGLKWIYSPLHYGVPGEGEDMIWLSHWKLENHLEGGDEVIISVIMQPCFQVKEFGIQLVQVQEENNMMITTQHNTTPDPYDQCVGSGDWYQYKPGVFLLSGWTDPIQDRIWLSKLFGHSDEDTDEEEEHQEDNTIEAQGGNGSFGPRSWKVLLIAAGFFLTLSVVVHWVLSLSEKDETVDKLSLNFLYPT